MVHRKYDRIEAALINWVQRGFTEKCGEENIEEDFERERRKRRGETDETVIEKANMRMKTHCENPYHEV